MNANSSIEIVKLSPKWKKALTKFFEELVSNGEQSFFSPHPFDEEHIQKLINYAGKDLYYVVVESEKVLGYGLLRGWDEGFEIPSLGIAVHSSARGTGVAKLLMNFLHVAAKLRGAPKMRLRVNDTNEKALGLYRKLGYVFEPDAKQPGNLIGFKVLGNE